MKCTNNRIISLFLVFQLLFILTGCGQTNYSIAYIPSSTIGEVNILPGSSAGKLAGFASDLCVIDDEGRFDTASFASASSVVLFDVNQNEVLYSKAALQRMYPASLTKVLTALVALKYGSLDQTLIATDAVNISESGAQLCGVKQGDTMTLDQALHILLIYSANDIAMMIAQNIGGSVEGFVQLMNDEAKSLGATASNFVNPHGLSDNEHYTTAYDLYLIFNEAIKYDKFNEIIHMTTYSTTYYDSNHNPKDISVNTTNLFLKGTYEAPEKITIIGGKTGTTNAAGHCLLLLSKDTSGAPYISVILCDDSRENLYSDMQQLLEEIEK